MSRTPAYSSVVVDTTKGKPDAIEKSKVNGRGHVDRSQKHIAPIGTQGAEYQRIWQETRKPGYGRRVADALDDFASSNGIVSTGRLAGNRLYLNDVYLNWLSKAMEVKEAAISCPRKQGKSSFLAMFAAMMVLGEEDEPPRLPGWRCVIAAVDGQVATETRDLLINLTAASPFAQERMIFKPHPLPGSVFGPNGRQVKFINSSNVKGSGWGIDCAILDEAGLFPERLRPMAQLLYSSTSNREGKYWMIGTQYDGELFQEMVARGGEPDVHVEVYAAPRDLDIGNPEAVAEAVMECQIGLNETIPESEIQIAYNRAKGNPALENAFRADVLNTVGSHVDRRMLVSLRAWDECCVKTEAELPPAEGPGFMGLDHGGHGRSMSAISCYWPQTGRFVAMGAFGDDIPLSERENQDYVPPGLYQSMLDREEIMLFPGATVDVGKFLMAFVKRYGLPTFAGSDRYRANETKSIIRRNNLRVKFPKWASRGQGLSAKSMANFDCLATTRIIIEKEITAVAGPLMANAIGNSELRFDSSGACALRQQRRSDRIDACQSLVISCGMSAWWQNLGGRKGGSVDVAVANPE